MLKNYIKKFKQMSLLDKASLVVTPNAVKESKLYSVIPNTTLGDMDVVRATTATRVNSAGLIEVVPRNLALYSEQFDNAAWSKIDITISQNSTTSPDGTITADKINETDTNSFFIAGTSATLSNSTKYTFTFYAKAAERSIARVLLGSANFNENYAYFNLATGITTTTAQSSSMQDVGNGWYRCTITDTTKILPTTGVAVYLGPSNNMTNAYGTYTGTLGSGIYVYGAQLEQGSTETEYFPTTTRLNIPRIDYTNGSCPSILVEPQRTNLCLRSQLLASLPWQLFGGTVTNNSVISPDGTQNANTFNGIIGDVAGAYQTISVTAGVVYTVSMYAKLGTATNICLIINNSNAWNTVGGVSFTTSNGLVANQWSRVDFTFTAPVTNQINIHIGLQAETGITAQSVGTFFIYGVQLEQGSYPTSYIPTVASTVTRNADVISKTGISSLIGQTEGTVLIDVQDLIKDTFLFSFNESTTSTISILKNSSNQIQCQVWGSALVTILSSSVLNERLKIAFAYKSGSVAVYINGVQVGTSSTTFTLPTTMDTIYLPYRPTYYAVSETAKYNSIQIYKTRLTNTELAQLTTI